MPCQQLSAVDFLQGLFVHQHCEELAGVGVVAPTVELQPTVPPFDTVGRSLFARQFFLRSA